MCVLVHYCSHGRTLILCGVFWSGSRIYPSYMWHWRRIVGRVLKPGVYEIRRNNEPHNYSVGQTRASPIYFQVAASDIMWPYLPLSQVKWHYWALPNGAFASAVRARLIPARVYLDNKKGKLLPTFLFFFYILMQSFLCVICLERFVTSIWTGLL